MAENVFHRIWKKKWIRVLSILTLGVFLVVGVPILIHAAFKAPARNEWFVHVWEADAVLGYYGGLLAVGGAAVGIWATIRYERRKFREDVVRQSLPFFVLTALRVDVAYSPYTSSFSTEKQFLLPQNHYEEYPLDKIYYVIKDGKIIAKSKLTNAEQKYIEHGGIEWERKDNRFVVSSRKYISFPFEIENAGNGVSAFTRIGFNKREVENKVYINTIPLKVGQKMYIHILCEDAKLCDIGVYDFEIYYWDIFMNHYRQQYQVTLDNFEGKIEISIITYSDQEKAFFLDLHEDKVEKTRGRIW